MGLPANSAVICFRSMRTTCLLLALHRPLLYPSIQISALAWRWAFMLQALYTHGGFPASSLNSPIGLDPEKIPRSALASTVQSILCAAALSLPHNQGISRGRLLLSKHVPNWTGGRRRCKSEYNLPTYTKVCSLLTGVTSRLSTLPNLHHFPAHSSNAL